MAKDSVGLDFSGSSLIRFDIDAFNSFIQANGVKLEHWKAITCPIGMTDSLDTRSPHHEHAGQCENGYIYRKAGIVEATFTNNSAMTSLGEVGLLDGSVVNVTMPQFYSDSPEKQIYVQLYDRFLIADLAVLVPNTQKVEAHITGIDRLTYRAESVEYIIDSHGQEYSSSDFTLVNGNIQWVSDHRPGYSPDLNKGDIYSIRYLYTPFFYCNKIIHEVRVASQVDFVSGARTLARVPYSCLLSREYCMQNKERSDNSGENDNRTQFGPRDGSFGPR